MVAVPVRPPEELSFAELREIGLQRRVEIRAADHLDAGSFGQKSAESSPLKWVGHTREGPCPLPRTEVVRRVEHGGRRDRRPRAAAATAGSTGMARRGPIASGPTRQAQAAPVAEPNLEIASEPAADRLHERVPEHANPNQDATPAIIHRSRWSTPGAHREPAGKTRQDPTPPAIASAV